MCGKQDSGALGEGKKSYSRSRVFPASLETSMLMLKFWKVLKCCGFCLWYHTNDMIYGTLVVINIHISEMHYCGRHLYDSIFLNGKRSQSERNKERKGGTSPQRAWLKWKTEQNP